MSWAQSLMQSLCRPSFNAWPSDEEEDRSGDDDEAADMAASPEHAPDMDGGVYSNCAA